MLRQIDPSQSNVGDADQASKDLKVAPAPQTNDRAPKSNNDNAPKDQGETPVVAEQKNTPPRRAAPSSVKRPTVAVDFGSKPARVETIGTMASFPLDVSQPSFKVSLDDGTGGSRTISVPTVSFGSRRVLIGGSVSSNQFAPKGDW